MLDLKEWLWIYTRINASGIWLLFFRHWTEMEGRGFMEDQRGRGTACVGCKGESASSTTANLLFLLFYSFTFLQKTSGE